MLSVQEAENIIFDHQLTLYTEGVPLAQSLGRILAEDIVADRDFPPFDRVTMDGIAIRFEDFGKGHRTFQIQGIQAAGSPQLFLKSTIEPPALEVMTGAILPEGCDTVIRYEDLKLDGDSVTILIDNISFQQNIHKRGIDRRQNDTIILRGRRITSAEIGTAATVGKSEIQVVKRPKIAIISTGDELVDIDKMPLLHQIRRSNVYSLAAILETEFKISSNIFHFNDDENAITEGVQHILNEYEIVVLSGAVSEGKFDFVPTALNNLGVKKLFHKVAQRPGKPFWFGKTPSSVIFALPGNPVSTFLCAYRYLVPFLKLSLNFSVKTEYAVLTETIKFKPDLTYFMPVKIVNTEGVLKAVPLEGHGSGDLANLNDADGFLELPRGRDIFEREEVFPLIQYR